TPARGVTAPDLEAETWQFLFGRRAFFGAQQAPNGDIVWFVNAPREQISREERASTTAEAWQSWLVSLFEKDRWPAAEIIRPGRLELAGDNTYDLGHVPMWHRDRMVIIGDAAHAPAPSSGQGASLAMEDAVVLAMALRDAPSIDQALVDYEAARRGRVEKVVAYGARSSSAKTPGTIGRVVRDTFLRVAFRYLITDRGLDWMYGHRIDWDGPLPTARRALAPV
ncbi:MAG TPA: FAD-dependent monooxygenase, partial [Patescibacteria group bacterium]|nr:FAD-dependent monooxygenase [Patescibacteria group bacterium]